MSTPDIDTFKAINIAFFCPTKYLVVSQEAKQQLSSTRTPDRCNRTKLARPPYIFEIAINAALDANFKFLIPRVG
ncbi:uncharacterized protein PHALS_11128 [Plasmopara halstedii]|uniref:Uncharacterized protein n=1 Tax=Plasmopara halstedii TaxID=4781 RepID=A0A0N7L5A8_PLAHL|nr:uncharacterized protein PHALS_11128 [Plasmopara halstedii]CEG40955.1 hypothetical protein PHALS_11128 [Plasmopara halstedii]|eukprot:XP_024577324.1 hypothetical protein PHALS_11128 [Plasmopara halstedii]